MGVSEPSAEHWARIAASLPDAVSDADREQWNRDHPVTNTDRDRAAAITALTATLTSGLDEDEAAAKAAAGEVWEYRDSWVWAESFEVADVFGIPDTDETGIHIARHDPSRTLRDVQAKRDLAAAILREPHTFIPGDEYYSCSQAVDGSGCSDPDRAGQPCDCGRDARVERLLRILVGVYEEGRLVVEVDARSGRVVGVVEPGGSGGGHLLQRPAPEWVWGSSEEEGEP